ncbi:transmembrane protein [Ceratobasidium sp. AG-Ba]|nr:transmembrane protein [Ceratobasidium sp. AG-Ba]
MKSPIGCNSGFHKLRPCIPSDYDRFVIRNRRNTNERTWTFVPNPARIESVESPGATGEPTPSPRIHPEGSFVHASDLVVSSVPVAEPLQKLGSLLLERAGFQSDDPKQRATVCLLPDEKGPRVQYYIIDHSSRTVVWADGDDVPNAVSAAEPGRAQNILSEEYWVHMENFPLPVPASLEDLHELKVVLASLSVDSSTSDGSTSPFTSAQIQEFLATLNTFTGKLGSYETYTIARLWCMIWHARVVNNYGTPQACLDRFTVLSERPPAFTGEYLRWVIFFIPFNANAHLERCSRAWAGRIAYVSEWRSFKTKNEREWSQVMWLACVLMTVSLLSRFQSSTRIIPSIALSFGCASAANSYYLLSESQNMGVQAADASLHFQKWETARYGVQALALRNAAPRALLVWGFFIFILSIF